MPVLFDIETEPLAREIIEATLPESVRNPVMPDEIAKGPEIDFSKCPKYGGDEVRQKEWKDKETTKAIVKCDAAQEAWKSKTAAAREKAFADAALDARTGFVRLIVMHDTFAGEKVVLVFEPDEARVKMIIDADLDYVRCLATEKALIQEFVLQIKSRMEAELQMEGATGLVGFYIKDFDLPFITQRAWINGLPLSRFLRRGRYWVDEVIDLREEFTFADNSRKTGGLDGLASALGCASAKTGDGAGFAEWYARDPIEGIQYGINDVAVTEECARRMGVI